LNNELENIRNELDLPNLSALDLRKNHGIFLKIGIVSETTGFFINRNNEATETTSEIFMDEDRLVVPASKWRGAERSYLLSEIRKVTGIIPDEYSRNMVTRKELLKNPTSLIFGDSSTGSSSEAAGIASRVFYDWAYSFEPLANITIRVTHNSLSEDGTILHENTGDVKSNAIYNTPYVKPGVKLIRYVTVENCSIEMLALVVMAITGSTRYGARTAVLGDNMKNTICGIGASKQEKSLSSFTTLMKIWKNDSYNAFETVKSDMREAYGEHLIEGERLEKFVKEVALIRNNKDQLKEICELINAKISTDWSEFFGSNKNKKKKATPQEIESDSNRE